MASTGERRWAKERGTFSICIYNGYTKSILVNSGNYRTVVYVLSTALSIGYIMLACHIQHDFSILITLCRILRSFFWVFISRRLPHFREAIFLAMETTFWYRLLVYLFLNHMWSQSANACQAEVLKIEFLMRSYSPDWKYNISTVSNC